VIYASSPACLPRRLVRRSFDEGASSLLRMNTPPRKHLPRLALQGVRLRRGLSAIVATGPPVGSGDTMAGRGVRTPRSGSFLPCRIFFGAIWCDLVRFGANAAVFCGWGRNGDRRLAESMQKRTADPPTPGFRLRQGYGGQVGGQVNADGHGFDGARRAGWLFIAMHKFFFGANRC
jgi:hypothetical protein